MGFLIELGLAAIGLYVLFWIVMITFAILIWIVGAIFGKIE